VYPSKQAADIKDMCRILPSLILAVSPLRQPADELHPLVKRQHSVGVDHHNPQSANKVPRGEGLLSLTKAVSNGPLQIGATVRVRREALGLTQEELAERARLHRTYLSDIERGTRNVSLLNIERLAGALSLSLSELFRSVE
jgi:DNA-binding XRE family transcriptional regulator